MNQEIDNLDRIVYISLPPNTERVINDFIVNDQHLIPVELPPGMEELDIQELSWEMIVSAMLKILAYQPDHHDVPYYREFILAVQPNIISDLTGTAIVKAEAHDYTLAEEIFRSLLTLAPDEEKTYLNLAFMFEQRSAQQSEPDDEALEEAFSMYKQGLERHPDSPDMHYFAGSFYLKQSNLAKTRDHFKTYLGLCPTPEDDDRYTRVQEIVATIEGQTSDDQLFAQAFDLIRMNKESDAILFIDQYLARHPDVWNAWFLKGWAHRRISEFQAARDALETCISHETEQTDVYNELAICCMELLDFSAAKRYLSRALSLEPENIKVISNFGVLEMKTGNSEEALRFFKVAEEIDPDDRIVKEYISRLQQ